MRPRDDTPWLHIRSQFTYHAEAEIRGTREGLTALRDAVNEALEGGVGEGRAYASDGEGYGLFIVRCATVSALGKPTYLNEEARQLAWHEAEYLTREEKHNRGVLARIKAELAASADTHPKDGDAVAAPLVSGAVPKADAQDSGHD